MPHKSRPLGVDDCVVVFVAVAVAVEVAHRVIPFALFALIALRPRPTRRQSALVWVGQGGVANNGSGEEGKKGGVASGDNVSHSVWRQEVQVWSVWMAWV